MGTVYRRKGTRFLWMKWTDVHGRDQWTSSGTDDEAKARALLAEIERQEREKVPTGSPGGLTVEAFFDEIWLPERKRLRPFAWQGDESRLRNHFFPTFGERPIASLATDQGEQELIDWLLGLRDHRAQRDGTPLAARSIRNIASIVRVFFADALERRVLQRDPCAAVRWDKYLPEKIDKMKVRDFSGFTLEQVVILTTDARIPKDRRVLYTLRFIGGGLRPSSEANARWRDLDREKRPLWRLSISTAFDTLTKTEKPTTKTGVDYVVPIHPVLESMLASWWDEGWERFIGRAPTADDLIIPRQDATQRRVNVSLEQFYADLVTLGLPRQRQYESRATFRNLCLRAGANPFHVDLITHPKAKSASDLYTRVEQQWEGMCAAVLRIDGEAWDQRGVTVRGDRYGTEKAKAPEPGRGFRGWMVTRTGIEPMLSA